LITENWGDGVEFQMLDNTGGSVGGVGQGVDMDEDYEDLPEELQGSAGFMYALWDIVGSKYVLE
jgi:hypothetical protein